MVNRPSVPEIITVNSEGLQQQIRDLLPSQNGFGSELQASNVITPIIDLTRAAEGSTVAEYLQTALAYGSQTAFEVSNATTDIINTTGFYRIVGCATNKPSSSTDKECSIIATDGATPKKIWHVKISDATGIVPTPVSFDLIVFLKAGETIQAQADSSCFITGSTRQIATGDGTLVQPNGFPL